MPLPTPSSEVIEQSLRRWMKAQAACAAAFELPDPMSAVDFMILMIELPVVAMFTDPRFSTLFAPEIVVYREFLEATLEYVRLSRLPGRELSATEECYPAVDAIVAECERKIMELNH